jgi:hypothetical protein
MDGALLQMFPFNILYSNSYYLQQHQQYQRQPNPFKHILDQVFKFVGIVFLLQHNFF